MSVPGEIHEEDAVSVRALPALLDAYPDVEILSLDCFDTLLWRTVHRPTDLFPRLQEGPAFARAGLDASQRVRAERLARRSAHIRTGAWEVTLGDILRTAAPDLDDAAIAAMEEEELLAECGACFPLPEAVELMRAAMRRKLPIVIVSDTYFREEQLRRLLASCLPDDVYAAISRVIVSCEHGASKGTGLFDRLSRAGIVRPEVTLHVGDNPNADLLAPVQAGIRARVLYRFPAQRIERMQDRASAWRLVDPAADHGVGMASPWHAALSRLDHEEDDPVRELGQTCLGPMMHGFARWIADKRREALASGAKLRIAFLMRDGHLPRRACEALLGEDIGRPVYVSRFSAFAASFRTLADIDRYLAMNAKIRNFGIILKQLGLEGAIGNEILRKVERAGGARDVFFSAVRAPAIVERVIRWSADYRKRMHRHLVSELGIERGDTLAFVDLGYFGNIQRALEPVVREEWGVELLGWYFMCYPQAGTRAETRSALIDRARYGEQTLRTLLPFMATLETLCTASGGSVRDYTADGTPVLEEQLIPPRQQALVAGIQDQAIEFVRVAAASSQPATIDDLRDATLAELTRLLYMPARHEMALFSSFSMDENMGSDLAIRISDPDQAVLDMRRDGIFFATRMRPKLRRNMAHELRHCGMELSLTTLSVYRNELSMRSSDWSLREEPLPLLYLSGQEASRQQVTAQSTYDGFYRARVPVGSGAAHVGLLLGERYRWVQVLEANLLPLEQLAGDLPGEDVRGRLILDQIQDHGDGLLECTSSSAFAMLPASITGLSGKLALEIVFRPILPREAEGTAT